MYLRNTNDAVLSISKFTLNNCYEMGFQIDLEVTLIFCIVAPSTLLTTLAFPSSKLLLYKLWFEAVEVLGAYRIVGSLFA